MRIVPTGAQLGGVIGREVNECLRQAWRTQPDSPPLVNINAGTVRLPGGAVGGGTADEQRFERCSVCSACKDLDSSC